VYAALLGLPLGILCGTFALFSRLVEPFVDFVRYMPAPVFGALAVAILGLQDGPKVAIIFIGTFFQMVLVVANTTRLVDKSLLEAAQTLGASNRQLLWHVVIPGALPHLYRDMRILIGWAWTYLVVAELIGEKSGISAFIYQQQRYRHFDNVYAAIVMIGLIGLFFDQVLAFVGRYLFPWESGQSALYRWLGKVWPGVSERARPTPSLETP
jgi:NitT/TauT family transport system permease protein